MSERVARSRELVAEGYPLAAVARVAQITRQALYPGSKAAPLVQARFSRTPRERPARVRARRRSWTSPAPVDTGALTPP